MIDQKTILKVAQLAKLHLDEKEAQVFSEQLSKALQYFDQISAVQTKGVEPLITPNEIEQYLREDEVVKIQTTEQLLEGAPQRTGNLLTVPPVV